MAATKLFPPTLAGTIPPFFEDLVKGTVRLTVPFTMNRIVSAIEVSGLSLRIKDADTGSDYGTIASVSWSADENNPEAVFDLGSPSTKGTIASKLVIGRYYKI